MIESPKWISNEASESIQKWAEYLHEKAKEMFVQDGTHANMLFLFTKQNGLVSIDLIPPNLDHAQSYSAIADTVIEHNLYAVILIGETWCYSLKENDHTSFQILDGEMQVSDLNDEDKKEALIVKLETKDDDSLIFLDEILRANDGVTLKESLMIRTACKEWITGHV